MDVPAEIEAFDWNQAILAHRGCLPHVRQENVIYFVTFRLADSLPVERLRQLRGDRDRWLRCNPPPHSAEQADAYKRIWTAPIENLLDSGYGQCLLRHVAVRRVVEGVIRHADGKSLNLGPFVIMPTHVHLLACPLHGAELGSLIKAWKSASARQINQLLGRRGSIWMEEYFDHIVRDDAACDRFVQYIQRNPAALSPDLFTLRQGSLRIPQT